MAERKGAVKMIEMPYFMTNKEWYYYDGDQLQLTDKVPKEAIESYKEYYATDTAPETEEGD